MALRVWLPLNGTLENKGISEYTFSSSNYTLDDNGKIGKCYKHLNCNITNLQNLKIYPMTIAFWMKSSDTTSSWQKIIMFDNVNASQIHGIYIADSARVKYEYNPSLNIYGASLSEWHHYAFVIDNGQSYAYYDGILSATSSETVALDTLGKIRVGEGNGIYLNDVRIYDHCLSPKEVKEISQGLVLHYKLDGWSGGINENLALDTANKINTSTAATKTVALDYGLQSNFSLIRGKKITISADIILENAVSTATSGSKRVGFEPAIKYSDNTLQYMGYWIGLDSTPKTSSGRYSTTVTVQNKDFQSIAQNGTYIQGLTSGTATIKNIKVELGDEATPWSPAPQDLGIDTTKITDSSGYEHDGTITGTLSTESDSNRYEISTHYSGSSYTDTGSGTFNWFDFSQCTLSAWIKPTASVSGWSGSIGIQHDQNAGHKGFTITDYANNFRVVTVNGSYTTIDSGKPLTVGEWHHCAAVLNGTNLKMYYDGAMVKESTVSWGSAAIATDMRFATGVDFPGSDEMFTGNYSDVRMYCTALSAEDILDLYHTSANVDDLGNLHGFEMVETHDRELITGEHFARLGVASYSTGTAKFDENGASYTGKVWAPNGYINSDYIEIKNTGYTYYYDITYSNSGGGMLDIGFERFDANKTSTSNSSCIYIVTSAAEINNMRITGTVNLAKDLSGNDVKYIRIRVLTDWNNSSIDNSRTANIKYFSLKEVPNNDSIAHHIYSNGVYESDTISDVVPSVSRQLNTGLSEFNDFIEK